MQAAKGVLPAPVRGWKNKISAAGVEVSNKEMFSLLGGI